MNPSSTCGTTDRPASTLREAVLDLLSEDDLAPKILADFGARDWLTNLLWLDASGTALYLLDRMQNLKIDTLLPAPILTRLQRNLADNRARTSSLAAEMAAINYAFEEAGIQFAHLKGLTLAPDSVSDPALRCQLDLDLLVSYEYLNPAQGILEGMGYRLHAAGGGTWEFKAGSSRLPSIDDLYKIRPQRSVELHFVDLSGSGVNPRPSTWSGQLLRAVRRRIDGTSMPVLCAADQFLNQALHLFGHLRGEFTRASWALEFGRHLHARRDDSTFWRQVHDIALEVPDAVLALGVTLLQVEAAFNIECPAELRLWTIDRLDMSLKLWVTCYARRILLADVPGNKLYLLLEAELPERELRGRSGNLSRLFPRRIPPMITHGEPGESIGATLRRYTTQARFLSYRLSFHLREGLRYRRELAIWHRIKLHASQSS